MKLNPNWFATSPCEEYNKESERMIEGARMRAELFKKKCESFGLSYDELAAQDNDNEIFNI